MYPDWVFNKLVISVLEKKKIIYIHDIGKFMKLKLKYSFKQIV